MTLAEILAIALPPLLQAVQRIWLAGQQGHLTEAQVQEELKKLTEKIAVQDREIDARLNAIG